MLKKHHYFLVLILTFFSGAILFTGTRFLGVVDAEPWAYSNSFGRDEKVHLYPGEAVTNSWSNASEALVQSMGENSTYQNFSAHSSAYVPIPDVIIDGAVIPVNPPSQILDIDADIIEETLNVDGGGDGNENESNILEISEPLVPVEEIEESTEVEDNSVQEDASVGFPYLREFFPSSQVSLTPEDSIAENIFDVEGETYYEVLTNVPVTEPDLVEVETSVVDEGEVSAVDLDGDTLSTTTNILGSEAEFVTDLINPDEISATSSLATTSEIESTPVKSKSDYEIVFQDFSAYEKQSGQRINNIQLRLSMAGKLDYNYVGETPWVEVIYESGDTEITAGSLVLDDELSNALNGSYYMFALPVDTELDDIAKAKVKVRYHGDVEALDGLYIDSVWFEVDSTIITKEDLLERINPKHLAELDEPKLNTLLTDKVNFTLDELPKFHLRYESQRNIATRMFREFIGRDLVEVDELVLKHHGLGFLPVHPDVYVTAEGIITIDIPKEEQEKLRPGTYSVELTLNEGGKTYTDTFDFQWGILTINPDKTEYELGETGNISIGALTPNGNTICKANLNLYIINPDEFVDVVPVTESGLCNGNNVVDAPDFSASYSANQVGEHEMYLERVDDEGKMIGFTTDTFLVTQTQKISIKRDGPTRIFPPASYPMRLTVESVDDFSGVLVEKVPASFDVFDTNAEVVQVGDTKELRFNVDVAAGQSIAFEYSFDAPDLSPYLFTLGPAHLESEVMVDDAAVVTDVPVEVSGESVGEQGNNTVPEAAPINYPSEMMPPENVVPPLPVPDSTVDEVILENEGAESIPATDETEVIDLQLEENSLETVSLKVTPKPLVALVKKKTIAFTEHRQWQVASDAVGNMILFWDNNSSIPSGWTCLSCGSGTFYQKFAMGSSTYNTTGGATTHTHTATGAVQATAAAAATESSGSGAVAVVAHTHTYTPTISSVSNLPSYRNLRVIQYTTAAGEPATIPSGAIAVFDASVPTDWTRYSAQDGYYIYGENTAGTTGGANTHTHTITGNTGAAAGGSYRSRGTAPQASGASPTHTHSISSNTGSSSNEPPYITVILGQASTNTSPANGMISMWTDQVGTGWLDVSSLSSDPFSGRFLKASTTYGSTGGASTSTHSDVTGITSGAPSATANANATAPLGGASGSHTHTVSATSFSTATHLPPYLTVVFGKRLGVSPVYEQLSSRWYVNTNAQTPNDPWASGAADLDEKEAITAASVTVGTNDVLRLRMNAKVSNATSTAGSSFKLQYSSTATVCSAASGWTDVGTTSSATIWRGYNNTSVSDGGALSSLVLASSTVAVTYEENGSSTSSPNDISVGGVGEWDFVLQNNGAETGTIYCFRLTEGDGTVFGTYTHYPQLLTNAAPVAPTLSKYFDNEKSLTLIPSLEFVSTDAENEEIDYQVQIATDSTFSSVVVDRNSISNSNDFTNLALVSDKPPFTSGETIGFVGTSNLTNGTTYWWRVRGKDTDGSDTWGSWSSTTSFTVDTSLTASAWHQTAEAQFETNTLVGVEATGANQVQLISGSTSGTMTTASINFVDGTAGTSWDSLVWNDTETSGDIKYQIQYKAAGVWTLIPDSVLVGNASGFDTSPVSLLDLDVNTYSEIRLVANFTNSGGSPSLQDWTVKWGYRVPTPTITSPFANEKVSTTTPTFIFVTDDAQDDNITYQIQWSTTPLFTSSTTRTSDADSGFVNAVTGGDTDPFNSNESIIFTIQSADALTNNSTYWWRVRAKDTTGDNVYSFWTDARSFTVDSTVVASTWFQTTADQFNANTLSGTIGASGVATVATSATEALMVYAEGSTSTPKYRQWSGSAWGDESDALGVGAPINWIVNHAGTTREEYVLATLGTDAAVKAQVFTNGEWSNQQTITSNSGNSAARGFDLAYETLSGTAMIVACNNATNPIYYLWDGSSWTSGGAITMNYTGNCEWLKLAANPVSDEIVLLARNAAGSTYEAQVWSGSAWGNSTTLGSVASAASEGMAVNYEASGNQAVVVTSDGNPSRFRWTAWNGTAWSAAATVATAGRVYWGEIVNNVGNDNMALCYVDHNSNIGAVRWTGAAWTGQTDLDVAGAYTTASRVVSCAFETTSGRTDYIMAAYSDATNARYRVWNGATWAAETSVSSITSAPTVQLRRTGDGTIIGTFFDSVNDRYDSSNWSGSAWSTSTTLETDASVASSPYKEPFMVAKRNPGSEGTVIVSPEINFSEGTGPYFQEFSWNDTTPGTSEIIYQLQYYTASGTWEFIPNSALAGNETGTTTGPIDLSGLSVSTYGTIRPYATLSCDGSNNCPSLNDWTVKWAEGISISGTIKQYDESTNVTSGTVGVAIDGVLQVGKTGSVSGGNWSIGNVTVTAGDVVTVFMTGAANSSEAVGVTRYDGVGNITGLSLFERHLSIGSDDATTTAFTNSDIGLYDYTNSEDVFINETGGTLNACADTGCEDVKIYVKSGVNYEPSGRFITHDFVNHGTFTAGSYTHEINGSWTNTGTSTMTGSTVVFAATSTTESIDSTGAVLGSFNNVTFGTTTGSGVWTLNSQLDILGNLTVSRGTLARGTTTINLSGSLFNEANGTWTGLGTTTFNGSGTSNWRDSNSTLQNVGYVVVDGTTKTISLTGNVAAQDIVIGSDDTLDVSTGNYSMTIYGGWLNQNTFVSRQGTVNFVSTTTGRVLTPGSSSFYNLTFNGVGGAWSFAQNTLSVTNNFTVATGTVTLPTATTTIAGSFNTASGTFSHNNGVVRFTATAAKTITVGGNAFNNAFYDIRFDGNGSWTMLDAATSSNDFIITSGTVTFPSSRLAIGGTLINSGGTFSGNGGVVDFVSSGSEIISTNSSSFANLHFSGVGSWSFAPANVIATGDLNILSGTLTMPTGTTTVGGSYANIATVNHNNGSVLFNSSASGRTIAFGSSSLYNVTFNSTSGGWTVTQPATTTNAFVLSAVNNWTLNSGQTLSVGNSFTNSVGGASTTWTGSTLSLESGSYSINTKNNNGDVYSTLRVGPSAQIKMWNSSAASYAIDSSSYLYSQDHAVIDGDLYIFGAYGRTSGTEYWRYNYDFDGTLLSGSNVRSVAVRMASGSSVSISNSTLEVVGTSTASTSISNQGSGTYTVSVSGGTTTMQYYSFDSLGMTGLSLADSAIITSLDDGYFTPATNGGTAMTVSSTTIDANPAKQIYRVGFATTTAIAAYNVAQTDSTPSSYWWFRESVGNLDGENFDNDTGNPGSIRWDDSLLTITVAGKVYQDAGVTPLVGGTCDGVTNVVRIVVDGVTTYDGTCSAADGSFSIAGVVVVGDPTITVYLNNASGGEKAVAVTRTPTQNISDLDLYANRLIVRNEDSASTTFAQLAIFDKTNDSDLPFEAATGTGAFLTTDPNTELYVWSGSEFAPEGDVTLKANAYNNSYDGTLVLGDNSTFAVFSTSTLTVGGRFVVGTSSIFTPASSTVIFNATTTGKSVNGSSAINFNELVFSGIGGSWNVGTDIVVSGDLEINNGTVTGTDDITVSGSLIGDGLLSMGSGTTTLTHGGNLGGSTAWTFYNLAFGNGSVVGTTTPLFNATTTIGGQLYIANAHFVNAGGTKWDLAGTGTVFSGSGTYNYATSTIRYSGAGASVASRDYYNLDINAAVASPTYTATGLGIHVHNNLSIGGTAATTFTLNTNDIATIVEGDVLVAANGILEASNSASLAVRGDWINLGTFNGNGGIVTFDGTDTTVINSGNSAFASVNINGTGSFTITANATSTGTFTLTNHSLFTLATGTTLAIGGTFTNTLAGAATTWSGSTLRLYGGGNYSVNASTTNDVYGTLAVLGTTQVRLWNSSASSYSIDSTASLYSQDHAAVDGDLYLFGRYSRTSGADYWSYATDFDGTVLSGGNRRAVDVFFANGASANITGGSLQVLGQVGATTTIQNQGSGTFGLAVGGSASSTFSYYSLRNMDSSGLVLSGSPTINSLSYGDIEISQNGGSGITVGGTVISANPAKTFTDNRFALNGVGSGFNVTATGTSVSSWRFTNHFGGRDGESYDTDPAGDPGYIAWDDSAALITITGRVYSDEGSTVSGVCDGSTTVINVRVAGLTSYTSSCNASTGEFSVANVAYTPGDSLVAYIDGQSAKGATVSVSPISSIGNFDIYENRVIARHESVDPITIANMSVYDSSDDADIPFTAVTGSPNTLTLPANRKLIVWDSKTFTPGGNITVTGGGAGQAYDGTFELQDNATFNAGTASIHTVGGSLVTNSNATFNAGTSEFIFTTTGSGRIIDTNAATFYKITFNGSGSWVVSDNTFTVGDNFTITAGSVTLPSATSTFGASFINNGGNFIATGTTLFTSTASGKTIKFGGSSLANVYFTGTGSWSISDTDATTTGSVVKTAGSLTLPSGQFAVGGDFHNQSGTVTHNTSDLIFTSTSTASLLASSSDLYGVVFANGGTFTMLDTNLSLLDSLTIASGTVTFASGTLSVGGSFVTTGGTFTHASGTVLLNSSAADKTINPGNSSFYNLQIGAPSGSYTLTGNATTTNNFTLAAATGFTVQSGVTLVVNGVFSNSVGGANTTWTGSTLKLDSGTDYSINTKTTGGDAYDTLIVGADSAIRAWNSSATTTTVGLLSSVYSQDHAAVNGALNIYGDFQISTTTEYWSYATDFDGTSLSGSERAVTVRHAANATTTHQSGTLNIVGTSGNETTITNQGSGTFAFSVTGGTLNASHYVFKNLGVNGLNLSGSTAITSLSYGDFELAVNGGNLITLSSTTLNANASLIITGNRFATTTAITGNNVYLDGTTPSAWTFVDHTGNLGGEDFDVDTGLACGSVRWDDSACLLTQQTHYRWRLDDGGEGVPDSEWFDQDWSNRKRVRIENSDAQEYTDAAIKLTVNYATGMQSDFDDLRFTDSDGLTPLSYFIEKYTASTEAVVWVKVPTLPANDTATVFMYFNNAGVSDTSSSTAVFTFADTFESGSISAYSGDTSLFAADTNFNYERNYGLSNTGHQTQRATDGIFRTDTTISQGSTIRFMRYVSTTLNAGSNDEACTLFAVQSPGTDNDNYAVCFEQFGTDRISLMKDVVDTDGSGTTLATSTFSYTAGWYEVEIDWLTDDTITVRVYKDSNLELTLNATDGTYTSGGIGFTYWYNYGGWDIYTARPYIATTPTIRFGASQVSGGASWAAAQDTVASNFNVTDTARIRFAVENTGLPITGQEFLLEYSPRGASPSCESVDPSNYQAVPPQASCGTSPVCMQSSSNVTNANPTADLLFDTEGEFVAGEITESPTNITGALDIDQNEYTELEYVITPTSNVVDQNLCFRVTDNGGELDTYLRVATMQLRFDPVFGSVDFNGGADISLTPGTTTSVTVVGAVTDLNGYSDFDNATATIYRSGAGASCTPDNNNCYVATIDDGRCEYTNCSGNSCDLSCAVDIYFHADSTDAGDYEGQEWLAYMEVEDLAAGYDFTSASGIELLTLRALDVDSLINYGSLTPDSDTGSFNPSTTITNQGNAPINVDVEGTDMTDGGDSYIPSSQQKVATSTFTYNACVTCQQISSTTPVTLDLNLSKPATSTPPVETDVYWGIAIPFTVSNTAYTGVNIFTAVGI